MATWLTHLRVAARITQKLETIVLSPFLVGNLAPDAGRILPDGAYDPAKSVTHFKGRPDRWGFTIGDWTFYRGYLHNGVDVSSSRQMAHWSHMNSFLLGYFCHLFVDNLWLREFPGLSKHPDTKQALRRIDAAYLSASADIHNVSDALLCDRVPASIQAFLPEPLIQQKVDQVVEAIRHPPRLILSSQDNSPITIQQVNRFADCAPRLFGHALEKLAQGDAMPDDCNSVLAGQGSRAVCNSTSY